MTRNVGNRDRPIRVVAVGALFAVGMASHAWPPVALGILLGLTVAVGFCPLYRLYGVSTVGGVHRECGDGACEMLMRRYPQA